jgi:hypothetical protein
MANHATLTDPELHDAKGVAAATDNTVPVATTGATIWKKLTTANLDTTSFLRINEGVVTASMPDVSAVGFVLIPLPKCTVNTIYFTLANAITAANSIVTITTSTGPATLGTQTIAFTGSAEGTTFTFTATTNNAFTAGSYIKIASDGGATTVCITAITVVYTKT